MKRKTLQPTRRAFLKGLTITPLAAGLSSVASTAAAQNNSNSSSAAQNFSGVPLHEQVWDFEKVPAKVPENQIANTLSCDILIVGSGGSGMPASVAAVETGKKVITIEKLRKDQVFNPDRPDISRAIGAWFGFSNNRLLKERGIKKDVRAQFESQVRSAHWRCNQLNIKSVFDHGLEVSNWWLDKLSSQGLDPKTFPIETHPERDQQELPSMAWKRPGSGHYWFPGQIICPAGIAERALEAWLNDNDYEITYGVSAKYLEKDDKGAISGLIAQRSSDGKYIRIKAPKVILCTGGFEGNKEMMKKYLPESGAYREVFGKKTNTGDGFLMAQWAGARMDPWPLCPQTWDGMNPEALEKLKMDYVGIARQAWLYVNADGKRFMNEDAPFAGVGKSMFMQPHSMMWTIWDDKWKDDDVLYRLKGTVCRRMTTRSIPFILPMNTKEATQKMIDAGVIIKANSIPELVHKMVEKGPSLGIGNNMKEPVLQATIDRYNELAKKGDDEDFGKDPRALIEINKPPYYACRTTVGVIVCTGGPIVDEYFRVMDKNGGIIPGLYACGNNAGGYNQYEYDMPTDVGSLGRACVSGYLAAKHAAGDIGD